MKRTDIPSESTFSRALAEFTEMGLGDRVHETLAGPGVIPLAPPGAARYKEQTVAERLSSRLNEEFGAGNVMVRIGKKVGLHLMFGVIALVADQLLKLAN